MNPAKKDSRSLFSARNTLSRKGLCLRKRLRESFFSALVMLMLFAAVPGAQVVGEGADGAVRFAAVEVFIDSGEQALAAWQFQLAAERGDVKIVGIEGGEHPAFKSPPYYDPAAMQHGRVVLAAFNTGADLPRGKTRIARIHVQIAGDAQPEYALRLEAAGGPDGRRIQATLSLGKGNTE